MNWLLSDFSIFGWHIQHWPLVVPFGAVAAFVFTELIIPD
jgi:hypothetical protein